MTRSSAPKEASPTLGAHAAADLAHARRVLGLEAEAIAALCEGLDARFSAAVDILVGVSGRVVVSGMGKSGHIARKIAATFASTGTPAQFVHPAEASHGDMGALTQNDAVMVLSNSGETRELVDLIAHSRRFAIPLLGIAGVANSMVIDSADVGLILPPLREACPMGLAPTTSTTVMLALGDALAVALMERRGFSADDYRLLHPGGQLGRVLIRVHDLMHSGADMPLVRREASMREAVIEMTSKRFGCAGVTDGEGRLIGIITDGDLRRHMSDTILARCAGDLMTPNPLTVRAGALAAEAVGVMNNRARPVTCLFVIANDDADRAGGPCRPVGILHMHDCLRAGVA